MERVAIIGITSLTELPCREMICKSVPCDIASMLGSEIVEMLEGRVGMEEVSDSGIPSMIFLYIESG